MKRGELVILWVGGILSSLVLIVATITTPGIPSRVDLAIGGGHTLGGHVVGTVFFLLAIWIICGLVWLTLYRRAKGD